MRYANGGDPRSVLSEAQDIRKFGRIDLNTAVVAYGIIHFAGGIIALKKSRGAHFAQIDLCRSEWWKHRVMTQQPLGYNDVLLGEISPDRGALNQSDMLWGPEALTVIGQGPVGVLQVSFFDANLIEIFTETGSLNTDAYGSMVNYTRDWICTDNHTKQVTFDLRKMMEECHSKHKYPRIDMANAWAKIEHIRINVFRCQVPGTNMLTKQNLPDTLNHIIPITGSIIILEDERVLNEHLEREQVAYLSAGGNDRRRAVNQLHRY